MDGPSAEDYGAARRGVPAGGWERDGTGRDGKGRKGEGGEGKRSYSHFESRTDYHFYRVSLFLLVEVTSSICTRQSTPGW